MLENAEQYKVEENAEQYKELKNSKGLQEHQLIRNKFN